MRGVEPTQRRTVAWERCGIKGFLPTSAIQGNPPLYEQNSLWEALFVVSQKWSFPAALLGNLWLIPP